MNFKSKNVLDELLFLLTKIALILLTFALLFTFVYGAIRYPEPFMAPSVKDGDLAVFYRYNKSKYLPGDTVVLKVNGQKQARRVVAVGGDVVDITEEGLKINGALQQESGIYGSTRRYQEGIDFPLTVPKGQVFLLADSRENAIDSRIYGCVETKNTLGKIMTVVRRRDI